MADFQSNTELREHDVRILAASVDSAEQTASLADELDLEDIAMASGLDAATVSSAVNCYINTGDRTFLQPTAFVLDPDGRVVMSTYSSGALGRLSPDDVVKLVKSQS